MQVHVRPLIDADVDSAREVQVASFRDYEQRYGETPSPDDQATAARQRQRIRHFLRHDPGGSWVAEVGGALVGVALANRRESLWGLSLLVVHPGRQSRGVGAALLAAALGYADGCRRGVIVSSRDPRAMRRYARAGFALHPQVRGAGAVDRRAIPALPRIRAGSATDLPLLDAVDAVARGARRGVDHELMTTLAPLFVADDADGRGYAYGAVSHGVLTVAATDPDTARELTWRCLAHDVDHGRDSQLEHITARQPWAVEVAVAAGLVLEPSGPVYWRGAAPPPHYLPCGPYL